HARGGVPLLEAGLDESGRSDPDRAPAARLDRRAAGLGANPRQRRRTVARRQPLGRLASLWCPALALAELYRSPPEGGCDRCHGFRKCSIRNDRTRSYERCTLNGLSSFLIQVLRYQLSNGGCSSRRVSISSVFTSSHGSTQRVRP